MEKGRSKTRIRRKNRGIKRLVLFFILIFIIILLMKAIIPASVTFSRYVYNRIRNYYLSTKEFYFTSDKLSKDGAYFEADNWSGKDEYRVDVNMYGMKNSKEVSKTAIDYTIESTVYIYNTVENRRYSDTEMNKMITYVAPKTVGQIGTVINKDDFFFSVAAKEGADSIPLKDTDYVYVTITTRSTAPYKETLTGEFKISVGNLGMSYSIEDVKNRPYLDVIVTNTLDYYTVKQAFTTSTGTSYDVGNSIFLENYKNLTDAEKAKCESMEITLKIADDYYYDNAQHKDILNFDTTSDLYMIAVGNTNVQNQNKEAFTYVKQITFPIDAEDSKKIRIYKEDASKNYTYPFGPEISVPVIEVTGNYSS